MRTQRLAISIATTILVLVAAAPRAGTLNGSVRLGGVFLDETGDRSAVQESYDLEEGFALSRVHLDGTLDPRSTFMLDLRDLNLRSRSGDVSWRTSGLFRLTGGLDQSRYVFDPGRGVTSERQDWRAGAQFTPWKWLALGGDFDLLTRNGERLAYPAGTDGVLGDRYDDRFVSAQVSADVRAGRRGGGVTLRRSDYADRLDRAPDRSGKVVTARLYAPMPFYEKWNNLLRGSWGVRELSEGGTEYTLSSFRYTGVLQPREAYELRYAFDASRVDDEALDNVTDRFQNDVDVSWHHPWGRLSAGYGYEMNDDDRSLTSYHSWRVGTTFRPDRRVMARVDYSGRVKKDEEELTLLKDVEASRVRARLELRPDARLTLGGDFSKRERELPDIDVKVDGTVAGALVRYDLPRWGALSADYSHSVDEYVDRIAGFETESDVVTARLDVARIPNVTLAGGFTYLDIGRDLDIEKSLVFVEGGLRFGGRYHLDAKYNCFNYDDYILLDRYYTANVVRVDLGFDLQP